MGRLIVTVFLNPSVQLRFMRESSDWVGTALDPASQIVATSIETECSSSGGRVDNHLIFIGKGT